MVLEGKVRAQDKQGNDKADTAADIGVKAHGEDVIRLANIFHHSHNKYVTCMTNVAKHIIEGDTIHRK